MALVSWPSYRGSGGETVEPIVRSLRIGPRLSQSVQSAPFGRRHVIDQGLPVWGGGFTIAETDDERLARAVELFLVRMRGAANTVRLDIDRPPQGPLESGTALTVASSQIADGQLNLTLSGAQAGIVAGDYLQIGGRLYIADSDLAAGVVRVAPEVAPADGESVVWESPYVVASLEIADEGLLLTHEDADFHGPWSLDWIERIG